MIELDEKKRIIQEFVPGKQVTLAHVIANPTEDLYLKLGKQGIETAELMKQAFQENGYRFYLESPTNQQFLILENQEMERLKKEVNFSFWETLDESHTIVRFATSWATTKEDVEALRRVLKENR